MDGMVVHVVVVEHGVVDPSCGGDDVVVGHARLPAEGGEGAAQAVRGDEVRTTFYSRTNSTYAAF